MRWLPWLLVSLAVGCSEGDLVVGRMRSAGTSPAAGGAGGAGGSASSGAGGCAEVAAVRRFDFEGVGDVVVDSLGGSPGSLVGGAVLSGDGSVILDGVDGYVDLPDDLLPASGAVSVEVWLEVFPGAAYRRVFDFGAGSDGPSPPPGLDTVGTSYLAVTPQTGLTPSGPAVLASTDGAANEIAITTAGALADVAHQVVLTLDGGGQLVFYVDGEPVGDSPGPIDLVSIVRDNHWLGRSQYDQDPYLAGRYEALRIYDAALAPCAVARAFADGP